MVRSLALCLAQCLPPVGSQGTIIKVLVRVLFVHIVVEVRLSDTDRGLEMFYGLFPHYYDNICVMLFFKPLYLAF